jgi:hypothetical protein
MWPRDDVVGNGDEPRRACRAGRGLNLRRTSSLSNPSTCVRPRNDAEGGGGDRRADGAHRRRRGADEQAARRPDSGGRCMVRPG